MRTIRIKADADEDDFRDIARRCLLNDLAPDALVFCDDTSLFAGESPPLPPEPPLLTAPRAFVDVMRTAICHRATDRVALLYDVLWRLKHGSPALMERASDPAVAQIARYAAAVRRDIHKMHAFLRFKERIVDGRTIFTAWFEPQHHTLRRAVPFFVDRFTSMDWIIATPRGTARWIDRVLIFDAPIPRPPDQDDDVLEEVWRTYYRTTFNPARLRVSAMVREMPKHYWRNLPEAGEIPALIAQADTMTETLLGAAPDVPPKYSDRIAPHRAGALAPVPWERLRGEALACTRCTLHVGATQTVFGEGPLTSPVVFVGEQPGDEEDLLGRPFIGPAGQMFDRALGEAGIDRGRIYLTNAVKHFKFEPRGKRRLHKRANRGEIERCKWWLERELAAIEPRLVVALGATAASSLLDRAVQVSRLRGAPLQLSNRMGIVTVHPSYLLRLPDAAARAKEYRRFVDDIKRVAELVPEIAGPT